jgi:YbbR domain-containing protein
LEAAKMMELPKRLPHSNTLIKILSVIAAFVLWLYVVNEQNPSASRTYVLELEKRNLPANLVLTDDFVGIRVRVSGPRYVLASVAEKDIRAYVDLQGINKGSQDKKVLVSVPPDLKLDEVSPDVVAIAADTLVSRNFPVAVRFAGQGAPELLAEAAAVDPNIAQVKGAAQLVGNIAKVEAVLTIDQALAAKGRYKVDARLSALDGDGNVYGKVALEPVGVTVTVNVSDRIITKSVPVKAVFVGAPPAGYRLRRVLVRPETVTLTGPFADLSGLEEAPTEEIDWEKLPAGNRVLLGIKLPPGVTADSDRVTVAIELDAIRQET